MRLYGRRAVITVDLATNAATSAQASASGVSPALEVTCGKDGFDCHFDILKDLTGKPNKGQIDIFNLNEEHRTSLSERAAKGPVRVKLEAGYVDGTSLIFAGDLRVLYHERKGPDWMTHIESGDGDRIAATARIFKSWAPGTPVSTVIKDVAAALDIGEGNVRAATAGVLLEGVGTTFPGGTAASGPAFKELERICRSAGLEWSIQDGTLQFLVGEKALNATAVSVTPSTGLVDTWKIHQTKNGKVIKLRTFIIPNLFPGRKMQLEDKTVWRVQRAHYHGGTVEKDWYIDIEGRPIS